MEVLQFRKNRSPKEPVVVTIGNFDGVHLGHQQLIHTVINEANQRECVSALVTFDPHPQEVLRPDKPVLKICTPELRNRLLEEEGLDTVHIIPFTKEFSQLSPRDFALHFLIERFNLAKLVIGYDFHFGKNRGGNATLLEKMSQEYGFELAEVSPFQVEDTTVSSTHIRNLIQENRFSEVPKFLGRPFSIYGQIKQGDQRGRQIGFPTANIWPKVHLPLENGVYVTQLKLNGTLHYGVTNVGIRPTFDKKELSVETWIFDFESDIYDQWMEVIPLHKIRNEEKFSGMDALKTQIHSDIQTAEVWINQNQL